MKFFALAAVASATRTRLRDFDPVDYTADWYGGAHNDEVYYAPNDPYVDYHDDHGHHGHAHHVVYADPTPVVYDDHNHHDNIYDGHNHHDNIYDGHDHYDDHYDDHHSHHDHHDHHYVDDGYDHVEYYADDAVYGNVPTGDFWNKVDDLNIWEEIWD